MDIKLTEKIQAYLNTNPEGRNVIDGATLLLSLNRNRIFFQNVVRNPDKFAEKVAYELTKHLRMRLDQQTISDVVNMDKNVMPVAQTIIKEGAPVISSDNDVPQKGTVAKGKRSDHDSLPDEIKALWEDCAALWYRIKELFEQLKNMEQAPACDRYEYLKQLEESDKKYRANMQAYDEYVPGNEDESTDDGNPEQSDDSATVTKKVNAARKYLSDNKKKLADYKTSNEDKYKELLFKVQERYNYLVSTGNTVDSAQVNELVELGLLIK